MIPPMHDIFITVRSWSHMNSVHMNSLKYRRSMRLNWWDFKECTLPLLTQMASLNIPYYVSLDIRPPKALFQQLSCRINPSMPKTIVCRFQHVHSMLFLDY